MTQKPTSRRRAKSARVPVEFDGAGRYKIDPDSVAMLERLLNDTEWDLETLMNHLAAPVADEATDIEAESGEDWSALLKVLDGAVGSVDTVWDKRAVVTEFATLVKDVGDAKRVKDVARALAESMGEAAADGLTPLQYIALGEIDAAGDVVRDRFGVRSAEPPNPYRSSPTVHIGEHRLGLYLDHDVAVLGSGVYNRMAEHIAACDACRQALEFCRRGPRATPRAPSARRAS